MKTTKRLRIAVMADPHACAPETKDSKWQNTIHLSKANDLFAAALASAKQEQAELVVLCGDITWRGTEDETTMALSLLEKGNIPWIGVRGNHDLGIHTEKAFYNQFGGINRIIEIGGIRFVLLDVGTRNGLYYHPDQEFLEKALSPKHRERTVLVTHFPVPLEHYKCFYDEIGGWQKPEDFWPLVQAGAFAAFSGHYHTEDHFLVDGVECFFTPSLCEYPFRFYMMDISPGIITAKACDIDDVDGILKVMTTV